MLREALLLVGLMGVFGTARASVADHYFVPTGSMKPTIEIGDRILVNKLAFGLRVPLTHTWLLNSDHPHPGDVVVLSSPMDGKTLVKRVMGVPGQEIAVRGGRVLVNGQVSDPVTTHLAFGGPDFGPLLIPEQKYLVLGDNRGDSLDGRVFGLVDEETILGKAEGIYWRDGFTWDEL